MVPPRPPARDTVVVVDDSPHAREAISRQLIRAGARCVAVQNRAEAELIPLQKVAAVLLDLELGDASGLAVCRAFREVAPSLPVAFLTACADAQVVSDAAHWGPVFQKSAGGGDAVEWAIARVRTLADPRSGATGDEASEKPSTSEGAAI